MSWINREALNRSLESCGHRFEAVEQAMHARIFWRCARNKFLPNGRRCLELSQKIVHYHHFFFVALIFFNGNYPDIR